MTKTHKTHKTHKNYETDEIRPLNRNIHRFDPEATHGELDLEELDEVVGAGCCNDTLGQCPSNGSGLVFCTKVCTCNGEPL